MSKAHHATSQQPPPLPPKMCRSISAASLRPNPLKPFQDRPSRRSFSEEDSLTEANTNMVSHSFSSAQNQKNTIADSCPGTMENSITSLSPKNSPGVTNLSGITFADLVLISTTKVNTCDGGWLKWSLKAEAEDKDLRQTR